MKREKILLVLLPFWLTLMPPLGIASLKSYLRQYNYEVTIKDANTENRFNTLKGYIPTAHNHEGRTSSSFMVNEQQLN